MSLPSGANPDHNDANAAGPGTAVSPVTESGVGPFVASASAAAASETPKRSFASRLLDYSAHAAMAIGLVGFAWTVGGYLYNRPASPVASAVATPAKPAAPKVDDMAELRRANQRLVGDVAALKANLDALRGLVKSERMPSEVRALQADIGHVKSSVEASRSETTAALAQINGKLEAVQREPSAKMQQILDRLSRLERQGLDTTTTATVASMKPAAVKPAAAPAVEHMAKAAAPVPPVKPSDLTEPDDHKRPNEARPIVLTGWVVRDVYDGVALIEGRQGSMEVVPGVTIPGAGVVKSIERHGAGWTVTTTKGQVAYAAPPRDYRRGGDPEGFYPRYRFGY